MCSMSPFLQPDQADLHALQLTLATTPRTPSLTASRLSRRPSRKIPSIPRKPRSPRNNVPQWRCRPRLDHHHQYESPWSRRIWFIAPVMFRPPRRHRWRSFLVAGAPTQSFLSKDNPSAAISVSAHQATTSLQHGLHPSGEGSACSARQQLTYAPTSPQPIPIPTTRTQVPVHP